MRGLRCLHTGVVAVGLLASAAFAETLPDPTRPADYSSQAAVQSELQAEGISWRVSAIRISDTGRSAIVNDSLVRVGDQVGTAKVTDIRPDAVVLEFDRRQVEVRIIQVSVKKEPRSAGKQDS